MSYEVITATFLDEVMHAIASRNWGSEFDTMAGVGWAFGCRACAAVVRTAGREER